MLDKRQIRKFSQLLAVPLQAGALKDFLLVLIGLGEILMV